MAKRTKKEILAVIEKALREKYPDALIKAGPLGLIIADNETEIYSGHAIAVARASGLIPSGKKAKVKKKP